MLLNVLLLFLFCFEFGVCCVLGFMWNVCFKGLCLSEKKCFCLLLILELVFVRKMDLGFDVRSHITLFIFISSDYIFSFQNNSLIVGLFCMKVEFVSCCSCFEPLADFFLKNIIFYIKFNAQVFYDF